MKVCHIITRMIVGGAQENTFFSARGLHESGHGCVLLTGPSPGPEGELLKHGAQAGFEIVECPYLVREISPYKDIRATLFIKKYLQENKFDVVHTHSSKAGIIGRLAASMAGIPVVVHTVHGLAFHRYEKAWKNLIYITAERWAAKKSDRIYAVAQAMINQCLEENIGTPELFKVVYSGMELEPFLNSSPEPELRKKLGIPEGRKVIGTVARLFPLKGYEELLEIAPSIIAAVPDVHFLIVGDGSLRGYFEDTIKKLGIADRFSFAGLVPPSEVYRYIALMNVLVHFSLREGLPRAAVQALASARPVVAYNLDGTPEVVKNNVTGKLIDPDDTRKAADAVIELLSDNAAAGEMGRNGRELVSKLFDWRRMSDILIEDYEKCLKEKKS